MKRITALILAVLMILPLCACSSGLSAAESETAEKKTEEAKTEEKKTEEKGEITYPKGFAVGYAIGDITGQCPLPIYDGTAETVHDPLMLTCVAVSDGEGNVALIMTADLKGMKRDVYERSLSIIEKNFNIPADNVMISATHTHSAPTVSSGNSQLTRWLSNYYKVLPTIVEEALRDLDELESCYTGKGIANSIAFVRRYLQPDGTYKTQGDKNSVAHESDADPELRTIRFDRKNKKDVLMVNFQTHYGGATSMYKNQISADFIDPFRDTAEKELDCHFAYYSGAGGNINFNSPIKGEKIYATFLDTIPEFMRATNSALDSEKAAQVGTIRTASVWHAAKVQKDSAERVAQAKEIQSVGRETPKGQTLTKEYGFLSKYEVTAVVDRNAMGETNDIPFSVITCGDLAFCAFPYEMFDTNGKEVRDSSPYDMTFILSLAGGGYGYIPSALAFPHGGYEVSICDYVPGSGEEFANVSIGLLNQCKNAA